MTFSRAAFHKIIKAAGAERVSDDAADALREIIEEIAEDAAKRAVRAAEHAGRRTIMDRDIELVVGEKKDIERAAKEKKTSLLERLRREPQD